MAADHLIKVCGAWQWKPSLNPNFKSKYLPENQQYLVLEDCLSTRRLNSNLEKQPEKVEEKVIKQEED